MNPDEALVTGAGKGCVRACVRGAVKRLHADQLRLIPRSHYLVDRLCKHVHKLVFVGSTPNIVVHSSFQQRRVSSQVHMHAAASSAGRV